MASGSVGPSIMSLIPVFDGDNFDYWSAKIKTLCRSQDVWDMVENGVGEEADEARLRELKKKDAKALLFIQQGLADSIFPRILGIKNAKEAFAVLTTEFKGSDKVRKVRLQSLRREFENLLMAPSESVQTFLSRAKEVVTKMKSLGEKIEEEQVVSKILRSLSPKFDHVVAAIEESKDVETLTCDDLMGSLQAHEDRLNKAQERYDERAFQVRDSTGQQQWSRDRGRRGRGGGRGRGWVDRRKCYTCGKPGHFARDCKEEQAEFAEEEEDGDDYLFMATAEERAEIEDT